jgi:tetratricopeptide (TPR) repeat protein
MSENQENQAPTTPSNVVEFKSPTPPASIDPISTDPVTESGQPTEAPADVIRAFDQDGREVLVPRAEWRDNVLPGMLKEAWENPDQLYILILNSLNEGFIAEMAPAAEHLYNTDPVPARGTCMWGIVLLQTGRLDDAERLFTDFLTQHGDEGSVLTNLAKVYALRNDNELAESTLWRALEAEPNLDNGVGWYVGLQQEKGGEPAAAAALDRLAALPGSWRAHLWQARAALLAKDVPAAVALYTQAIDRAPKPTPGDLLMQMSGDLGAQGHLNELIALTQPQFVPEAHGLPVGNNLLKANIDTGNVAAAAEIHHALALFNRPDWAGPLAFWQQEIAKLQGTAQPGTQQPDQQVQIGMLRMDGPVWLPAGSPGRSLFGAKTEGGPSVTFLGGTAETASSEAQVLDGPGRMSRALPLFLAEQVEMRTGAQGRSMLPWAMGQQSGFVVSNSVWTEDMAVQSVSADAVRSDYVVTTHIDASVEPWTAELVFIRTADGTKIGALDAEFPSDNPAQALLGLADEVVELLGGGDAAPGYTVPADFTPYLARLEQLLAVRCASMDGVPPNFLTGEREILAGNLQQAAAEPENLPSRLLLVETFGAIDRVRPGATAEFREAIEKLMTDHPIAPPTATA